MDFLLDALTNWLKEMLVGGIMGNLSGMFDSVNQQVADIATQVGQTPQGWNGSIFSMIQNLSNCALYVDVKRHCVIIGEQEVYLSANEFEVFYMLYLSPQITFTKEQIYEKIWHEPTNNHLHAVENTVFQIRKRLKPHCKGHEYIKTVVGYGYKFNSD